MKSQVFIVSTLFLSFIFGHFVCVGQEVRLGFPEHGGEVVYKELLDSWEQSKKLTSSGQRDRFGQSSFEVKYTGFSPEARAAFQFAVDIWDSIIKSDIKIQIFATWAVSANINNLGSASPVETYNFQGAPIPEIWYPMPLAEKLKNEDVNNPAEADIVANFNSGRSDWYFGTDGNCPADKFDLVTVILHEIAHGLGISSTMVVNGGSGFFGASNGRPKVYDVFLVNSMGTKLVPTFSSGSIDLAAQLQSNSLTFDSRVARILAGLTANPRIYAPNPYNGGSSISHVDQNTYSGTVNDLMTPFASRGKVRHQVGPIIQGILYEMGWLHTYMSHSAFQDKETLMGEEFVVEILSDTLLETRSTKLVISDNGFQTDIEVELEPQSGNLYRGLVDGLNEERDIRYYFRTNDILGRSYRLPLGTDYFGFYLGEDKEPPVIQHTPPISVLPRQKSITLSGIVSDNLGLLNAEIEYKLNETGSPTLVLLELTGEGFFEFEIDLEKLGVKEGDNVFYKIVATDKSNAKNTTSLPSVGFYGIAVKTFDVVEAYSTNFNSNIDDFFGDFSIRMETGFINNAVHSPHPYENSMEYFYELLVPIKVRAENAYVSFDEVVLVEPGTGTDFRSSDFKDYVIVEASNHKETSFIPLVDGYDSRSENNWLGYYQGQINVGNSAAVGTLNYFQKRRIDLLEKFEAGDTIRLRFRLFSDSDNYGWGWAIDNLDIQGLVTSIEATYAEGSMTVYPNPAHTHLFINVLDADVTSAVIYNSTGYRCSTLQLTPGDNKVDISTLVPGVYILVVSRGKEILCRKFIVRH